MNFQSSKPVQFQLNGVLKQVTPTPGERLSETLRERLDMRDVKIGCDAGDCGACSVLVDGDVVCACLTPTHQAGGKQVETLKGLYAYDDVTQDLAQRFLDHSAAQCGICTPGMMVAATALLRDKSAPSEQDVKDALGGVLCRCTGYRKIIDAVMNVAPPIANDAATDGDDHKGVAKDHVGPMGHKGNVGDAIRRLDGEAKISGTDLFGDDIAPPGTKEILVIRSPFPRASFAFGDLDAFQAQHPSIVAILNHSDIKGQNAFGVIPNFQDQPVFAVHETRFRGEAVAAIVAEPDFIKDFNPAHFPIAWSECSSVHNCEAAQMDDANILHHGFENNVMCGGFVAKGDAAKALKRADHTVSGRFVSGFVEHGYIEPEAGFAKCVDGRLEIYACTQAPVMDLEALEQVLAMDRRDIRIIPTSVGGGFGSKLDISVQPILALAALKTKRPVRLTYSRTESMQSTTKRHPSDIQLTIGADQQGKICGFEFFGEFDTGAYASWGPTVANRVPVHASGPYVIDDYKAQSRAIYTNNPPAGAFRGFGVPQSAIAQEQLFDELANKIGIDPLDFRILNAMENGRPTVCGQVFEQGVGIKHCFEALKPVWDRERADAEKFNKDQIAHKTSIRRGVGVAGGWYGCGNTSLPNPSTIKSGIRADGTVVLHQGAMDIGQGANTVISQIFATALGVDISTLHLVGADTDITPDAGKTSASRQTFVSGNAARLSGEALRLQILQHFNVAKDAKLVFDKAVITIIDQGKQHHLNLSELNEQADGYVLSAQATYDPPTRPLDENGQGSPYAQFGYAAQVAVLEVDLALGTVRPVTFYAAHDVGRAINPVLVEGQVHGGIAQGLGMALMEEYIPGRTENLHDYLIPTIGDLPPITTFIIEQADGHGPYGAKGLGEHVLVPTAPSILNAIRHATGARLNKVPATPERVKSAIQAANDGASCDG